MICSKNQCTGCYGCLNACNNDAIDMIEDKYGYIYPKINDNCINCGLCKIVCPNNKKIEEVNAIKAYASWSIDYENRKTSTSGGVASILSQEIISRDGIVFGAAYSENLEVNHIKVTNKEEINKLKGSKYVQSKILNTFKEAKKSLIEGKEVLFIGTPCQIAGLKGYLNRDYINLITMDIVCHGVPSLKMLKDYVKEEVGNKKVDRVNFREGSDYIISFFQNNEVIYRKVIRESTYFMGFMESLICRENCSTCKYAKEERISDITIGDFWGLGKEKPFNYSTKEGVSLVLINTEKGETLVNSCKERLFLEERAIKEAVMGNSQLREPSKKSIKKERFEELYIKKGFSKAIKISLRKDFTKYKIKKILLKLRIVR